MIDDDVAAQVTVRLRIVHKSGNIERREETFEFAEIRARGPFVVVTYGDEDDDARRERWFAVGTVEGVDVLPYAES